MAWLGEGQHVDGRWCWSLELQSMLVLLPRSHELHPHPVENHHLRLTSGPCLGASLAWLIFHILCYWDCAWNSPINHPHSKLCSLSSISAPLSPSLFILPPPPLHFSLLLLSHCLFPLVISSLLQVQLSPLPRCLPDVHLSFSYTSKLEFDLLIRHLYLVVPGNSKANMFRTKLV